MDAAFLQALQTTKSPEDKAVLLAEASLSLFSDEEIARVARQCVLFHWFDQYLIEALLSTSPLTTERAQDIYQQITALPFVEQLPWGTAYQDLTRQGLLKYYAHTQPELLESAARLAVSVYRATPVEGSDRNAAEALFCSIISDDPLSSSVYLEGLLEQAMSRQDWQHMEGLFRLQEEAEQLPFVEPLPRTEQYWMLRSIVDRTRGQLDEAISDYTNALALNPHNALAHLNRGILLMHQQHLEQATTDYYEALRLDASLVQTYRDYGIASPLHKYDEEHERKLRAREHLLRSQPPSTAQSLDSRAALSHHQGKYKEAEPLLKLGKSVQTISVKHAKVQARRAELLRAARAVLAEKGFEATTISEIVARAGVAQGTFYLYFPSKISLVVTLAAEMQTRIAQALRTAYAEARSPGEMIDRSVQAAFAIMGQYRDILALVHSGIRWIEAEEARSHIFSPYHTLLAEMIERAQDVGIVNPGINAQVSAVFIVGAIYYSADQCYVYPAAIPPEVYIAEASRFIHQALGVSSSFPAPEQSGPDHLDVAQSLHGLATLYWQQGQYSEAEPLYQRALSIWEQSLGSEHPYVAYPLHGLATLYNEQGRYAEAEPLYQRALRIREQQLGPEHPDTAETLHDLATFYEQQGHHQEALALLERALASREQVLGPDHPKTRATREWLTTLRERGGHEVDAPSEGDSSPEQDEQSL